MIFIAWFSLLDFRVLFFGRRCNVGGASFPPVRYATWIRAGLFLCCRRQWFLTGSSRPHRTKVDWIRACFLTFFAFYFLCLFDIHCLFDFLCRRLLPPVASAAGFAFVGCLYGLLMWIAYVRGPMLLHRAFLGVLIYFWNFLLFFTPLEIGGALPYFWEFLRRRIAKLVKKNASTKLLITFA